MREEYSLKFTLVLQRNCYGKLLVVCGKFAIQVSILGVEYLLSEGPLFKISRDPPIDIFINLIREFFRAEFSLLKFSLFSEKLSRERWTLLCQILCTIRGPPQQFFYAQRRTFYCKFSRTNVDLFMAKFFISKPRLFLGKLSTPTFSPSTESFP